ncbi:DUF5801 repeats-in-toxin domain-containing protein, partial [Rhodopseudomonas pentothenatexigens]|uniref:T1SS-143 repeat domain-containing protein n=1 Tax=Rhodopseudomonas TaxID=1073 RepID=UPI003D31FC64
IALTPPAFKVIYVDGSGVAHQESVSWSAGTPGAGGATTWTATSTHYTGATPAATLTINADGSYSFTTFAPVVHPTAGTTEENLGLSFAYTVTDGDGDTATGSLTVDVNDDTPTLTQTYRYNDVYESALSTGNATDGSIFAVHFGADGYGATAFTGYIKLDIGPGLAGNVAFDLAGGAHREPLLTSEGRAITFVKVDDNTIRGYVASADNGGHGDETILEIKLTDTDASATTTLYGVLDHMAAADDAPIGTLRVDAAVAFSDGDGDVVTGVIRTTIHDDVPVAHVGTASAVEDESVNGGNNEADGLAASVSNVSLNIAWGADDANDDNGQPGDRSVAFTDANVTVAGAYLGATLTSLGQDVSFKLLSSGELVGYTGSTVPTATTDTNVVLFASLSDVNNGEYSFTLVKPLDQAAGNGEAPLSLTFNYTATDGDGDRSSSTFTVNVVDDMPVVTGDGNTNTAVHEAYVDAVSGVQPAGTDPGQPSSVSGVIGKVNYGADGFGGMVFTGAFGVPNENSGTLTSGGAGVDSGMTSDGRPVLFRLSADGLTIEGYVPGGGAGGGDELILQARLNGTDTGYTVNLFGNIDHQLPNNSNSRDDAQSMSFTVQATDGDGDSVNVTLSVRLNDDAPVLVGNVTTGLVLDEDDLATGTDPTKEPVSAIGNLNIDLGADGGSVALSAANASWSAGTRTLSADDGSWTIVLNGDGTYTFTLLDNTLAHGPGNNGENPFDVTVTYTAVDGDGDSLSGTFAVSITDDAPVARGSGTVAVTEDAAAGVFTPQTANGTLLFDAGADDARVTGIVYRFGANVMDMDAPGGFPALTSHGQQIVVSTSPDGLTITGMAGATKVFDLVVTNAATGAYTFTQYGPIDHPDINQSGTADFLRMVFDFTVTDGDGDKSTSWVQVDIRDDAPVLVGSVTTGLVLDEDDLATGTDPTKEPVSATGNLNIDLGADGGSVALAAANASWSAGTRTLSADDGSWTIVLNGDGTYTFTLLDNTL